MSYSYGGRDSAIAEYNTKMLEMGLIEEEMQLYGCLALLNNDIEIFITEHEEKIIQYQSECEKQNCYSTPILEYTYWNLISKGEKQTIKRAKQFDVASQLVKTYNTAFFEIIGQLNDIPATNNGIEIFEKWKKELEIYYNFDYLCFFEATLAMTLRMKLVTNEAASAYFHWILEVKKQLQNDIIIDSGQKHIYAGFAYYNKENKAITYKIYTKPQKARKEQNKRLQEGFIVTPVFTKNIYYDPLNSAMIQSQKEYFSNILKELMSETYFERLEQLYLLPSIIPYDEYIELKNKIYAIGNKEEINAFNLYAAQLRLL